METPLSVTASFWQPGSELIHAHHRSLQSAANEEDQEMAGLVGGIQQLT